MTDNCAMPDADKDIKREAKNFVDLQRADYTYEAVERQQAHQK